MGRRPSTTRSRVLSRSDHHRVRAARHVYMGVCVQGYIVDNYCWNMPNHVGIDGTKLDTSPGSHYLHCLTCCGCPRDGYTVLARTAAGLYERRYQLDAAGDKMMEKLAADEIVVRVCKSVYGRIFRHRCSHDYGQVSGDV